MLKKLWKTFKDPARPRARMTNAERRVVRAVAEAMFYDGVATAPGHRLDWMEDDVDDYFSAISETTQAGLKLGFAVVQLSPMLTMGRLRRLTSLPIPDRVAPLRRLESTRVMPLMMVFILVKVMVAAIYFEHPEALAETGFDGTDMMGPRADAPLAPLNIEGDRLVLGGA